jgi:Holliday junction resolvase
MRLLFEGLTRKLRLTKERLQKFEDWIENANKADNTKSLDARTNQYDKAEELITFYTFAPIELRKDKANVIQEVLKLANIRVQLEGEISLDFEKQFKPSKDYLKWLENEVAKHPVKYIRKQGLEHIANGKPLETNTHVDVVLESNNFLILIEMKFTSDISAQTTFNVNRNQLARIIDVGISEAEKKKKLIILLCSPSQFSQKRSRFFYYKIQEYSDFKKIKEDTGWRGIEKIKQHVFAVNWLPLEKVIAVIYKDLDSPDLDEAMSFFKERNLI